MQRVPCIPKRLTGFLPVLVAVCLAGCGGGESPEVVLRSKLAYVANSGSNNVSAFTISATTGALTPVAGSPFAAGTAPVSVAVDPSGKFAYVANRSSDNISAFTINATTGVLTAIAGSPFAAGTGPIEVTTSGTIQ